MGLREKYAGAIRTAKGFHMNGSADEREGKLYFKGTVNTPEEANKIWDAIKTVPDWRNDIVADIQTTGAPAAAASTRTYTVKAGDTLTKIAQSTLGDSKAYGKIYEVNRDQLSDPNAIKPGQVLRLP